MSDCSVCDKSLKSEKRRHCSECKSVSHWECVCPCNVLCTLCSKSLSKLKVPIHKCETCDTKVHRGCFLRKMSEDNHCPACETECTHIDIENKKHNDTCNDCVVCNFPVKAEERSAHDPFYPDYPWSQCHRYCDLRDVLNEDGSLRLHIGEEMTMQWRGPGFRRGPRSEVEKEAVSSR